MLATEQFIPSRTPYVVKGVDRVLVVGIYKGFKSYWVENASGQCVSPHLFYKAGEVEDFLIHATTK